MITMLQVRKLRPKGRFAPLSAESYAQEPPQTQPLSAPLELTTFLPVPGVLGLSSPVLLHMPSHLSGLLLLCSQSFLETR